MKQEVKRKAYESPVIQETYVELEDSFCGSVFEDKENQNISIDEHGFSDDALINGGQGPIYEDDAWTN